MSSLGLRIKHLVAVSPLARPAVTAQTVLERIRGYKNPELALLKQEDAIINKLLPKLIRNGDTCLDIGGHIGSVAYQMQGYAGKGNVHIVEAVKEKAEWLSKAFGDENVHQNAITTAKGTVEFFQDVEKPGFSSLSKRSVNSGNVKSVKVECAALDDLFGALSVDFIKIDVEGHELDALTSGVNLLKRDKPTILFEAGPDRKEEKENASALFDFLTVDCGYEIYAAFDLLHRRRSISKEEFSLYRTYPFLAFNYFAVTPETRANLR